MERVGDVRASLQLMTFSALAPLLNADSFIPVERHGTAKRRMAFILSIDGSLPGNEFPNAYRVCKSVSLNVKPDEIEAILESIKQS